MGSVRGGASTQPDGRRSRRYDARRRKRAAFTDQLSDPAATPHTNIKASPRTRIDPHTGAALTQLTSPSERAKSIVKAAFATSPISRLKAKEAKAKALKDRLSRTKTTWWDAAAVATIDGTLAIDRALNRSSCHAGATLITLAKGRMHAQADIADVEQWRAAATRKFLNEPSPKKPAPSAGDQSTVSPGHYQRKYGAQQALPPLRAAAHLQRKLRLNSLAAAAQQREAATKDQRSHVFGGGHARSHAAGA